MVISGPPVAAQQIRTIGSVLPQEFLRDKDGDLLQFWIPVEGYRPKVRWDETAQPAGPPLPFLDPKPYFALEHHVADGGEFYLLGRYDRSGKRPADPPLGWVRADILIRNEAKKDPGTSLYHKAMLVNRVQDVKNAEAQALSQVKPLLAPRTGAPESHAGYNLFNIFFEYARTQPKVYGPAGGEEYVLIGNSPYFRSEGIATGVAGQADSGLPQQVIRGWVPVRRIVSWLTREGWAWDHASTRPSATPRRVRPGRVYLQPDHALADILGGGTGAAERGIFDEAFDTATRQSIPMQPHHMRYPNLELRRDEIPASFREQLTKLKVHNELRKVGAIGGYGDLSAAGVDDLKRRIQQIDQMVTRTEILFVIDDTGSMDQHFSQVAEVVDRIYRETRSDPRRNVFVGVSFYNDVDGHPERWNPVIIGPLVPANTKGADFREYRGDIVEYVRRKQPNSGGDEREMLFYGIKAAVEAANFTRFARKLVIVIGDTGDAGARPGYPALDEAQLARLLYGDDRGASWRAPVELLAIQVSDPEKDPATRAFETEMTRLVDKLNAQGNTNPKIRRTLGVYARAGSADLVTKLNRRYDEIRQERVAIQQQLQELAHGAFHTEVGSELKAILATFRVDLDRLRQPGGVQLFNEGYVWQYAPGLNAVPQVRSQLLLAEKDIEDVIEVMDKLVRQKGGIFEHKLTVEEALARVLADYVGDPYDKEKSFYEKLLAKNGIVTLSPLLTKKMDVRFPARLELQELENIVYRVGQLRDIKNGVRRKWIPHERLVGDIVVTYHDGSTEPRPDDRSFTLPGDTTRWYWIDVETEMP